MHPTLPKLFFLFLFQRWVGLFGLMMLSFPVAYGSGVYNLLPGFLSPRHLYFLSSTPGTYTQTCSPAVYIGYKMGGGIGNVMNTPSYTTLLIEGSPGLTFYLDPSCTNSTNMVHVDAGFSTAHPFYYQASTSGVHTIKVSTTGARLALVTKDILPNNPFIWMGGGGDANWSTGTNWSGGVTPDGTQQALFNGDCVSNCSPTITSNMSVYGVKILSGYNGTITQNPGVNLTIGLGGWLQESGTFMGGDSSMWIGGLLHVTGGNFRATSGTLTFGGTGYYSETVTTLKLANGASFNANGGTLYDGTSRATYRNINLNMDVDPIHILNNLTIYPWACGAWWYNQSSSYGVAYHNAAQPLQMTGTLNYSCERLAGTFKTTGNISIETGAHGVSSSGVFEMNGTGLQTYSYQSGAEGPYLKINKTSGSVEPAPGTTDLNIGQLTLSQGTFTAPSGTLTVYSTTSDTIPFKVDAGTTFLHNNGLMNFEGSLGNCSYDKNYDLEVNSTGALTLNHVAFTGSHAFCYGGYTHFRQTGSSPVTIEGDTTLVGGMLYGSNWFLQGALIVSGTLFNGGTAALNFSGNNHQNISHTGGVLPTGNITVNKGSGVITQDTSLNWSGAGQGLTITAGTWNMNGYNLNVAGALSNLGTLTQGTAPLCGTLTYGSFSGTPDTCP